MLHFPADKIYLFDATNSAIPVKIMNEEFRENTPNQNHFP